MPDKPIITDPLKAIKKFCSTECFDMGFEENCLECTLGPFKKGKNPYRTDTRAKQARKGP